MYLGLPIGASARRKVTWLPVLDKIRARLTSWNSNHISFGGKVVLLKSVLYALPTYFFIFFQSTGGGY